MSAWPAPIRTARGFLPAEMRVLRGGLGFVGGVALVFGATVQLLGGNWQLGFRHDWILTAIFFVFFSGAVGILSPLWFWLGRPVWFRVDRPGAGLVNPEHPPHFLAGLAGAVLGLALMFPVSATSRFPVQPLFPLGLFVGITTPLWYWVGRPIAGARVHRSSVFGPWFVEEQSGSPAVAFGRRVLPAAAVVLIASFAVTAAIALPVAAMGEPVVRNGLAVTVSDSRTTTTITRADGEIVRVDSIRVFLLVHVTVENQAGTERSLPNAGTGDITLIAPECRANNFGEPSNNCNLVYLDGAFTADGDEYRSYAGQREAAAGTIAPRETVNGWMVYRLESPPSGGNGFEAMVIVDEIGRWSLGDDSQR